MVIFADYELTPIKLGCEVRGIDLRTENRLEVIEQIKSDVTKHRLLVFKNQGVIDGPTQIKISEWFGDLENPSFTHNKAPHPAVFRVSNDANEGCTKVGVSGWHIAGSFQPIPSAFAIYHMISVPKRGATSFAPFAEIFSQLSPQKLEEWQTLWMVSTDGPVHPLIYRHPISKKEVFCFHLGLTSGFIYNRGTPYERTATNEETQRILKEIANEFNKDDRKLIYKHEWEVGDFIITDNRSLAHEASPESQLSPSEVGLRILHRTVIKGTQPPCK